MDQKLQKKPNKSIVFKPRKQFRILLGQLDLSQIKKDLVGYNQHLYRVFTVAAKVDNAPPFLNPYTYVNPRKLQADADRLARIDSENKDLLIRINAINRSPPRVDCWSNYCKKPNSMHRVEYNYENSRRMTENIRILKSLEAAKSEYNKHDMMQRWKKVMGAFDGYIRLGKVLHTQRPLDEVLAKQPSLTSGLGAEFVLPRRKAFLDLSIKNGVRLGQIVVELYYEYSPKMVKNFLAHCDESARYNYINSRIFYAEKNKFIALGDVTTNNGRGGHSIYDQDINVKQNDLTPTRSGLLMAMPVKTPDKFDPSLSIRERIKQKPPGPKYNSQFAVTLSECQSKTGKMPIFGKIVKGNSVLKKVNDMLRTLGAPLVTMVISRCGVIPFTREEEELFATIHSHMVAAGIILESEGEEDLEESEGQDSEDIIAEG